MSKQYYKRFTKKQCKGAPVEDNVGKLYDSLNRNGLLNPKLKAPEMKELLVRLRDGYLNINFANKLATTVLDTINGPAGKVLALHTEYTFEAVSLGPTRLKKCKYLITRRGNTVSFWARDGRKYDIPSEVWVYAIVIATTRLPTDLREWPVHWVKTHFQNASYGAASGYVGSKTVAGWRGKSRLPGDIRKVRQMNPAPGKAQRKRAEQQREKFRGEIDGSFSLDE